MYTSIDCRQYMQKPQAQRGYIGFTVQWESDSPEEFATQVDSKTFKSLSCKNINGRKQINKQEKLDRSETEKQLILHHYTRRKEMATDPFIIVKEFYH